MSRPTITFHGCGCESDDATGLHRPCPAIEAAWRAMRELDSARDLDALRALDAEIVAHLAAQPEAVAP